MVQVVRSVIRRSTYIFSDDRAQVFAATDCVRDLGHVARRLRQRAPRLGQFRVLGVAFASPSGVSCGQCFDIGGSRGWITSIVDRRRYHMAKRIGEQVAFAFGAIPHVVASRFHTALALAVFQCDLIFGAEFFLDVGSTP